MPYPKISIIRYTFYAAWVFFIQDERLLFQECLKSVESQIRPYFKWNSYVKCTAKVLWKIASFFFAPQSTFPSHAISYIPKSRINQTLSIANIPKLALPVPHLPGLTEFKNICVVLWGIHFFSKLQHLRCRLNVILW